MISKIQHLRGTPEEYLLYDQIIPDGELALVRRADGTVDIKIGDGVSFFSALPFVGRTVENTATESVLLRHSFEHRLGEVGRVELLLPEELPEDFTSVLTFGSGLTGCTFSYPAERIVFVGDHTKGGVFFPEKRNHYTLSFYQREHLLAYVSALSYEIGDGLPREVMESVSFGSILYQGKSEDILDVTIDGKYKSVDAYGEVTGVGTDQYGQFLLKLTLANKTVLDYESFVAKMTATYKSSSVTLSREENAFCYYAKSTMANGFISSATFPFPKNVTYHLHMTVSKRDCEPLTIGEYFDTGLRVVYTDGTAVNIRSPYTGGSDEEGFPMQTIDFFTDSSREINYLGINYTPEGATNVLRAEDFYFVADDGTADVPAPETREVVIELPSLLLSVGEIADTLSLGAATLTKRVHAQSAMDLNCTVEDDSGSYTIYRYELTRAAKPHSPIFMWGFYNRKLEELSTNSKSCCVDGSGRYVYFTLTATDKTLSDYEDFAYDRTPVPMYLLPEEEALEIDIPEIPFFDGFNAVCIQNEATAKITVTHYN